MQSNKIKYDDLISIGFDHWEAMDRIRAVPFKAPKPVLIQSEPSKTSKKGKQLQLLDQPIPKEGELLIPSSKATFKDFIVREFELIVLDEESKKLAKEVKFPSTYALATALRDAHYEHPMSIFHLPLWKIDRCLAYIKKHK